jgi:nuclease S1
MPTHDGDRGGNDVRVEFEGRQTNLHAVWDSGILAGTGISDERAYAPHRRDHVGRGSDLAWWKPGGLGDEWPHGAGVLPASYEQTAIDAVNVQLEKAGVRLAAMLNDALR